MPWTYDPYLQNLLYTTVGFKSYLQTYPAVAFRIKEDLEVPFFQAYDISPRPVTYPTYTSYFSYNPSYSYFGHTTVGFKARAETTYRTFWKSKADSEIPFNYSYPSNLIGYPVHAPNYQTQFVYHPYYKNMFYDAVAFRAKAQTGPVSFWRGIPDPEAPFAQLPVAEVDPPYQEIGLNQSAYVSGAGSRSTANNPAITIDRHVWDWGDGFSSEGIQSSHQYAALGSYTGKLTVTDSLGNKAIANFSVVVTNSAQYRVLYAGSDEGELAVTFNDGNNWRIYPMRGLKSATASQIKCRSVAVHPDNRLMAVFGFNDGRIYKTEDGLRTVQGPIGQALPPDDINAIKYDPFSGFQIYAGTESGKLYQTSAFADQQLELVFNFGKRIKSIDLAGFGGQKIIVGGTGLLSISKDGGQTWTSISTAKNITNVEFSKVDTSIAYASAETEILKINCSNNTISDTVVEPGEVTSVSGLANIDGVIASRKFHPYIRRASPFGALIDVTQLPGTIINLEPGLSPVGTIISSVDMVMADRNNQDKWFWTYDNKIFRTYYSTYSQVTTTYTQSYNLLTLNSRVYAIAQGRLVSSYDGFDFDFPIFIPPIFPPFEFPPFPPFPPIIFPTFPPFTFPPFPPITVPPFVPPYITVPPVYIPPPSVDIPIPDFDPNLPPLPDIVLPPDIPIGGNFPPTPSFKPPNFSDIPFDTLFPWGTKCKSASEITKTLEIVSTTATSFDVIDASSITVGSSIVIDGEEMEVTGITGGNLQVARGANGTFPVPHYTVGQLSPGFLVGGIEFLDPNAVIPATIINATQTIINIYDDDGYGEIPMVPGMFILIDNEIMTLVQQMEVGGYRWEVLRGRFGTEATEHTHGRIIYTAFALVTIDKVLPVSLVEDSSKRVVSSASMRARMVEIDPVMGTKVGISIPASYPFTVGFFFYLQRDNNWPATFSGKILGLITALDSFGCDGNPLWSATMEYFGDTYAAGENEDSALMGVQGWLTPSLSSDVTFPGEFFNGVNNMYNRWLWCTASFGQTGIDTPDLGIQLTDIYGNLIFQNYFTTGAEDGLGILNGGAYKGGWYRTVVSQFTTGITPNPSISPYYAGSVLIGPYMVVDHWDEIEQSQPDDTAIWGWKGFKPSFTMWMDGIEIREGDRHLFGPPPVNEANIRGNH